MSFENNFASQISHLEKEYYPNKEFYVDNKIISIDGIDGVGKSSFSEKLTTILQEKYGKENVVLMRPTKFSESKEAKKYGDTLHDKKNLPLNSRKHNLYFVGALHKNYEKMIKDYINQGKIVVLDSSEIRALAYMLDKGEDDAIDSTLKWLRSGRLTGNILPGNRIILEADNQDILDNLHKRKKIDIGDPVDIQGVQNRLNSYNKAMDSVKKLKTNKSTNWINVQNPRITENVELGLDKIIRKQILNKLKF
ncbi:hypothetical protein KKG58_04870 [Patescibacteria group bacterium]|nr:hypothetical protein [Patescibacteria group bacterium]